jgi:putative PIN family toxin of toxin-antitoxin system
VTRAVLDTNTLVSGALALGGPPSLIINAWLDGEFELVTSEYILEELARTLGKPYFVRRLSPATISAFLELVRSLAATVAVTTEVSGVAPDPSDDEVIATALVAQQNTS